MMKIKNKAKLLVRFTVIYIASYFIYMFINAYCYGIYKPQDYYVPLLEFCLFVFASAQGQYHCKFLKFTILGIFISDTITRLDNAYDFIPLGYWCLLPAFILSIGILTTLILSFKHFIYLWNLTKKKK